MKAEYLDIKGAGTDYIEGEIGVYFRDEDYASAKRRLIAAFIDIFVILLFSNFYLLFVHLLNDRVALIFSFVFSLVIGFSYLTFLKSSVFRTIGYRVTDIKIVNLDGSKPAFYDMFIRLVIFVFGTYDFSKSRKLMEKDPSKQSIRDKYLGHYVVRAGAKPVGSGPVVKAANYYGKRYVLVYKKVDRDAVIVPFFRAKSKKVKSLSS